MKQIKFEPILCRNIK